MRPGAKFLHSLFEVTHVEFQTYDILNHKLLFSSGVIQRKRSGDYIWVYSRQMIYEKNPVNHICTIIREVEDVTKLVELQEELKAKVDQLKIVSYKNSHLLRSPVASIIGLVTWWRNTELQASITAKFYII